MKIQSEWKMQKPVHKCREQLHTTETWKIIQAGLKKKKKESNKEVAFSLTFSNLAACDEHLKNNHMVRHELSREPRLQISLLKHPRDGGNPSSCLASVRTTPKACFENTCPHVSSNRIWTLLAKLTRERFCGVCSSVLKW